MDLRRRENEDDVCGRFFERLQQGVERRVRQHMHFVDDVHTIVAAKRRELDVFTDFAHIVHTGVGGAVDFYDIGSAALRDFLAVGADITGPPCGSLLAIEGFGKNARDGRFPDSASPGKQVRVGNALR